MYNNTMLKRSFTFFAAILAVTAYSQTCMPPTDIAEVQALPSGTLINGIGDTDLPITSKSEKAKKLTQQGFALIHCFWFNEAVRSFRDATKEDPSCAAAWLGLNIVSTLPWHRPGNLKKEADYAIQRAMQLSGETSELEQGLIAAFRLRNQTQDDRESPFEKALDAVIERHPKANEPRLLLSGIRIQLCLNDGYDDNGDITAEMAKVAALIEPVLKRDPDSAGGHHYWIHAFEGGDAAKALKSADALGRVAPASSHMVHMPGHIYNRVGMYTKAHEVFSASERVDREEYLPKIPGSNNRTNWNYGHNLDYMSSNLIEMGRVKEALAAAEKAGRSSIMIHWRAGNWKTLADLAKNSEYYKGMAAIEAGDFTAAQASLDAMKPPAETPESRPFQRTGSRLAHAQRKELEGVLLAKKGNADEAIRALEESIKAFGRISYEEPPYYSRLPHESLGPILIEAGKYDQAIQTYKDGLYYRPKSGWLLYGIALAHDKAGRKREAEKAYKEFLAAWPNADEDLTQVKAAKAALQK